MSVHPIADMTPGEIGYISLDSVKTDDNGFRYIGKNSFFSTEETKETPLKVTCYKNDVLEIDYSFIPRTEREIAMGRLVARYEKGI